MSSERKSPLQLLVEERTGREIEALLRELYIDRRWTHQEIATYLSDGKLTVGRTSVVQWCREYDIDRSDRVATLDEASA